MFRFKSGGTEDINKSMIWSVSEVAERDYHQVTRLFVLS